MCGEQRIGQRHPHHPGRDHPRVCGEQDGDTYGNLEGEGSPPRVRGTECQLRQNPIPHRITPACAGNSVWRDRYAVARQDHPRVCGEQISTGSAQYGAVGSPPRVRGTASPVVTVPMAMGITPACAGNRRGYGFRAWKMRITPACAGNSALLHPICLAPKDHPRVCGEQGG